MSHVSVERNRRRQMNDRLKVLRSLTPPFYIKKGDQASVIGGVIDFMKELHQVLQSLESQKRRKTTSTLSPSPTPSPRLLLQPSPCQSSSNNNTAALTTTNASYQFFDSPPPPPAPPVAAVKNNNNKELAACCNSCLADVEAKISGSNVILKTVSRRVPGQLVRIISLLEKRDFEILHLNISSMEDTVLYSFVVEIGLECQLTMEELVSEVQQTFSTTNGNHTSTNSKAPLFG